MVAKTFSGLEEVLAAELKALGAQNVEPQNRAASFSGGQAVLYNCNLWLRTALRVLKPIHQFAATNEQRLYRGIQEIDWRRQLNVDDTFAVNAVTASPYFTHSQYAALKVKDAIVDQFRQHTGRRPSVDPDAPALRLHVHIVNAQCSVALDSSGDSLHRRGYRQDKNEAPLNEALAAGLVLISGWRGDGHFVDPMCGSGTILIEAAMAARNIAPGLNRKFCFMNWKDFDRELWQRVRGEALDSAVSFDHKIAGADISAKAVRSAQANIQRAGLSESIELGASAFENFTPPGGQGLLIMNPPYGERMKKNDIESFYRMIGDSFKERFAGYDAWVFSGNKDALKSLGLRPSQKYTLFNGGLECKFQKYSIYRGSVKSKYTLNRQA
jgi:putative N6-adenine-specific DNA methylase